MSNRWVNRGNSGRLYFGGSKITADDDNSHEIKRHSLLGRKVMTNLDSILKIRDIIWPTVSLLVKAKLIERKNPGSKGQKLHDSLFMKSSDQVIS